MQRRVIVVTKGFDIMTTNELIKRVSVRIPANLHRKGKIAFAKSNKTFQGFFVEKLRNHLEGVSD